MYWKLRPVSFIKVIILASTLIFCLSCRKAVGPESWLDSLHKRGRKIFYQSVIKEVKIHPQRNRLTDTEIKKIIEAETRYDRLYELLINIFFLKDEPIYMALLENGSDESKNRFSDMYLELARFSAHNFVDCFFFTDAGTDYVRSTFPAYKGMDAVDLIIRSLGYHAKLDIPERKMFENPLNPEFDKQGALDAAKFREAHKITKGKGAKIAILDSGIDDSHSVFKDTLWGKHFSLVGRIGKPWNTDATVIDWGSHGTLITSVATRYAPEARITMYKLFDGETQNDPAYQLLLHCIIAAGIYKAVHDGNDVISISASGASLDADYLREACQYAYDNNRIVISGNLYNRWLRKGNNLNYPGQYETVISVTAAEKRSDGTYGYWEICAPDATTAIAAPNDIFGAFPTYIEAKDTYIPSISAAIPTVAALAAMTVALYPQMGTEAAGEYAETIKKLILQNANHEIVGFQGFSPECGYGLIDAGKTVRNAALLYRKRAASLKNH